MIWRGKQYIRGIKLFYRKNGRFPTSVEDLTKPKMGSLRFMRQAYKDPVNKTDGSWRLIYVGPAGQLMGSLKPPQTFQMPGAPGVQPLGGVQSQAKPFGSTGFGQSTTPQGGPQSGTPQQGTASAAQGGGSAQGGGAAQGTDTGDLPASPITSDNPIMGGNIIGVGSKVNKRSVIVYDKAKNYRLFEFVWNPSKDLMNAMGQPATAAPATGQGQSGFGPSPTNPSNTPQPPPAPQPPM